jgi:hypothetical protein
MPTQTNAAAILPATQEIAHALVRNHLRISLEPSEWRGLLRRNEHIPVDSGTHRVIVVVGSGASKSVGLPLASEALTRLREESIMPNRALDAELDRLSQTYQLERNAFETYLHALSTSVFESQKLRDNLQKMYGHRFMPILGYEILAHMLKHRFLDAIINFNFDELLDQAVEDELDPGEYYHILSDGDCPDDNTLRETRPELPFYIKPHGTASHKSTLRFTREDYYGLPLDIKRVLKYLLTDKPVVLLVIGFGMQSLEFNHILKEAKQNSLMFHINKFNPTKRSDFSTFLRNELLEFSSRSSDIVSETLQKIWQDVAMIFRPEYRPRDITRHILVARTFFRQIDENNVENYLKGRTVIELCLSIAKGKGLVTISQLSADRSGKYFDRYKAINDNANFYDMCRQTGLKDIGYSREAMRLMKEGREISKILEEKNFEMEINFLYNCVRNNLDPASRDNLSYELFCATLLRLYQGEEVELRYRPRSPYTKIFRFPKAIPTYTAFKFHTKQIFKQDWKYLFVVAETGQWLTEKQVVKQICKRADFRIRMIVADTSWIKEIRAAYGEDAVDIRKLPWWEHNRHMTILADENEIPFTSLYFHRRLRSANIIPILLDNVDDTLVVMESFNAYWLKSDPYDEKDVEKKDTWISSSDAKNFRKLFSFEKMEGKK